ncbi:sirohydrochlorin chelatase [Thalassospira profundimaris]|uniref:Cobalamin biosynthesis protein CbiX n=1 Tax=Thalassospira profundimaris TaxID=502049 RepID=A0A367WW39_9PROT|nr:hypothetical protein [Thalassospira profundimaris]RCK45673.1 hypothetical protein TH30_11000 [Thalassospira profundimaris]
MLIRDPVLIIVAHGTQRSGALPGEVFQGRLQQLLPHFEVRLAFLHSSPDIQTVLEDVLKNQPADILLFPLLFSQSIDTVNLLSPTTENIEGSRAQILPAAGCLPGFGRMLTHRVVDSTLPLNGKVRNPAVFLVSHGRKSDRRPARNFLEIRNAVARSLGHNEVYNVQLEGCFPLDQWRERTQNRKAVFIPLMAGDGFHCRVDIPAAVDMRPDENLRILSPVGTWWELSVLLAEYVNLRWLDGGSEYSGPISRKLTRTCRCLVEK